MYGNVFIKEDLKLIQLASFQSSFKWIQNSTKGYNTIKHKHVTATTDRPVKENSLAVPYLSLKIISKTWHLLYVGATDLVRNCHD